MALSQNVRRIVRSLVMLLAGIALAATTASAQDGPVIVPGLANNTMNTYPNEHHYVGLNNYREGDLANAALAFDLALSRTRKDPSGRWIDSIPVLAMIGECLYQTGDLAGAVENFDAALAIAIRHRGWLRALTWNDLVTGAARAPDPAAAWAAPQIPNVLPLPNRISIASGELDASMTLQRGGVLEGARLTRIDAIEVMRGLALAFYRRGVIFGEITGEFEIADQTLQALLYPPEMQLPVGRALIGSIRGCGKFASGDSESLASDIGKSAVPGGVHPLTPLLLLAGARQAALSDQPAVGLSLSMRAAAAASALGQPEWVGEALLIAAGCVDSRSAVALQTSAVAAASAHLRRGRLASLGALAAAADAALTAGDLATATTVLEQLRGLLGQRGLQQPRLAAHGEYLNALAAASGGASLGDGSGAVDEPLARLFAFANGSGPTLRRTSANRRGRAAAAATPRLFQLAFVSSDARGRGLAGRAVEARLAGYVDDPSNGVWRSDPVDAIAYVAFDRSGLVADQFAAAVKRGSAEGILIQADHLLRNRFLTALPLGGRIQQVRTAASTARPLLGQEAADWLDAPPARLRRISEVVGLPAPPADSAEAIARGRQLESLATQLALSRGAIPSIAPRPLGDLQGLSNLPAGHGLLTFIDMGSATVCVAVVGRKLEAWPAPAGRALGGDVVKLLRGIGVGAKASSVGSEASAKWGAEAAALRRKLIPNDKLELLSEANHWTIVPDGVLWYLPFEALPLGETGAVAFGEQASVRYAPTPGLAIFPTGIARPDLAIGVATQLFLAPRDRNLNQRLVEQITEAIDQLRPLPGPVPTTSQRVGDTVGFFTALGAITPDLAAPLATNVSLYDSGPATGSLAAWMRLSANAPAGVFLPGYRTAAAANSLGSGRELFMTLTALHLCGVRDVILSRWPVGGESTAILTREFLQELPFEGLERSWKRALQTLRAAKLDPEYEPLLGSSDVKQLEISGNQPLFWAGYLLSSPPVGRADQGRPAAAAPVAAAPNAAAPNAAAPADAAGGNLAAPVNPAAAMPPGAPAGVAQGDGAVEAPVEAAAQGADAAMPEVLAPADAPAVVQPENNFDPVVQPE